MKVNIKFYEIMKLLFIASASFLYFFPTALCALTVTNTTNAFYLDKSNAQSNCESALDSAVGSNNSACRGITVNAILGLYKYGWTYVAYYRHDGGVDEGANPNACETLADIGDNNPTYSHYKCVEHYYNSISKEGGEDCPNQSAGNPINVGISNKYQSEKDYAGTGPFPLSVIRTYNSITGNWRFLPEIFVDTQGDKAVAVRSDGKKYLFTLDGSGSWNSDPNVTGTLESLEDGLGVVTGWRCYTTLDNQIEEYQADGTIASILSRAGFKHNYTLAGSDLIVTHSNGAVLIYQLDNGGNITGFIDPESNQYTYSYDTESRLSGITYPNNGGTRVYHYEDTSYPNALTGITDANGNRFATWAYDSNGRPFSSEHNNGVERVTIDYSDMLHATNPRVVTTNALGKETTYHFTSIYGKKKVTQVEGHQSANCAAANKAYTYDANGFVASKTDWKGNTTSYIRNAKGQELSRTEAEGTPQQRTITTEWHPTFNLPVKITEPERETVITYDANGNELTRIVSSI